MSPIAKQLGGIDKVITHYSFEFGDDAERGYDKRVAPELADL
ncbi:hypothetical protein OG585_53235 (plasmid) [Streptomyces sp. NBC_01340]|nr:MULTISPECIES: hypothetical protein [unclassified Streptomyces]MCX4460145.1 hypothetical protein [Streptomyces sp. NBC_01719]MCX4500524.1 hypothetical protein [Streptomyces sp. NBC_01728]MCX4598217.1 hypothetical protein [Streptomyces sp. NBC_01549]WSI45543.1 hypothetical protein OG585_53235 [Streptomyces sp. NBC_01340]